MTDADLAIGYEPLWAIGSGRVPTSQEIVQMHAHIRKCLVAHLGAQARSVRILYGGSVNPADAREILALPGVGGALVGGASLKAEDFAAILASAASASPHRVGRRLVEGGLAIRGAARESRKVRSSRARGQA
jgi:triosephosphate isomerase